MSSEKIHLSADVYSVGTSEPHFMHWFIHFIWGGVMDYAVFFWVSNFQKKFNIFYLLILLPDEMERKNGINIKSYLLVEFENGAVRQENQLGQKPCKTSSLIGWHSELEDKQLWKQIQSGYKADFSFISINYHTHQKLLLKKILQWIPVRKKECLGVQRFLPLSQLSIYSQLIVFCKGTCLTFRRVMEITYVHWKQSQLHSVEKLLMVEYTWILSMWAIICI